MQCLCIKYWLQRQLTQLLLAGLRLGMGKQGLIVHWRPNPEHADIISAAHLNLCIIILVVCKYTFFCPNFIFWFYLHCSNIFFLWNLSGIITVDKYARKKLSKCYRAWFFTVDGSERFIDVYLTLVITTWKLWPPLEKKISVSIYEYVNITLYQSIFREKCNIFFLTFDRIGCLRDAYIDKLLFF